MLQLRFKQNRRRGTSWDFHKIRTSATMCEITAVLQKLEAHTAMSGTSTMLQKLKSTTFHRAFSRPEILYKKKHVQDQL